MNGGQENVGEQQSPDYKDRHYIQDGCDYCDRPPISRVRWNDRGGYGYAKWLCGPYRSAFMQGKDLTISLSPDSFEEESLVATDNEGVGN